MSQMNGVTARNLYEFGDYFKKMLVLSVITVIVTPIAAVVLFFAPLFAAFLAFVILGLAIAILVFEILMIIRLSRAKDSSPHPELIKAFQMLIASIIVSVLSIALSYIPGTAGFVIDWLCSVAATVLQIISWQSLAKYIAIYSTEADPNEGFPMVAEGVKTYITFTYVSIGISVINFILGFFDNDPYSWGMMDTISIIISLVSLVISIIILVAQFKVANGMKLVFGNAPQVPSGMQYGAPPPSTQQPQQYGVPQSAFKQETPSSEKVRYCSKCGTKIVGDAKFCTSCGETLE